MQRRKQLRSAFAPSSTLALCCMQQTASPWEEDCSILTIPWSDIALITFLELSTQFLAALDTPRMFCPLVRKSSGSFAGLHTARNCCSRLTASSSRLRVPSSHQVWRQSVQVDDHHLCPGMPLNPVDDTYPQGPSQHVCSLGDFPVYRVGWYSHTLSPSWKPAELASWL